MALIAPSVLSADFLNLQRDLEMINASEADWFHLDVMDGVFVPNITFGMPIIKMIASVAQKPLDVHLMITQPERYIDAFAAAGAQVLTVHYEASIHLHRTLQQIKAAGMKAGIAINPHTPVSVLADIITDADVVCVMSVNPGFGGQSFIPHTRAKIRKLKEIVVAAGASTLIEVDGGVTLQNAALLEMDGADVLVAGNTVFSAASPAEAIKSLKAAGK
ncbi:MAG: ribulose-phosphate 3-epimerase [Chitinophagia bacterium]|nr:ribulose-phosphate 3-epimerase [Chitinophagia bacterium]